MAGLITASGGSGNLAFLGGGVLVLRLPPRLVYAIMWGI
jgi:hypothetical protein